MRAMLLAFCCLFPGFSMPGMAQPPSPAGGGMLLLDGEQAYAAVPPSAALLEDYHEGITVEGWLYLDRYPTRTEVWSLVEKPGAFQLALQPSVSVFGELKPEHIIIRFGVQWQKRGGGEHGTSHGIRFHVPLHTWLYFYGAVGKMQDFLVLDGEPDEPLYVGRKFGDIDLLRMPVQQEYVSFPGALDEVRISNIQRPVGGMGQVYLGLGADLANPLPAGRFEVDQHTVALWHFDDERVEFADDSEHHLTMFAHDGAFNPQGLAVIPLGKHRTTWAEVRTRNVWAP